MIQVVVHGVTGKMASALARHVQTEPNLKYLGSLACRPSADPGESTIWDPASLKGTDPTIVDFTNRASTAELLGRSEDLGCKLVIGTSGLSPRDEAQLAEVAKTRAVFRATNFSRGVHTVLRALAQMRHGLDDTWQAQVLDLHFRDKVDTPSATAKRFAETAQANGDIAALRLGDGVSEHTAILAGTGERIELAHKLLDRKAFFPTVVDAIQFLDGKDVGLFGMDDLYPLS